MKNTNIFNGLAYLFALLIVFTACDLEENPQSFISPDNFFNTPTQIESVLASSMRLHWRSWGGYGYDPGFHRHSDQNNGGDLVITQNYGAGRYNDHFASLKDINHALRAIADGKLDGAPTEVKNQLVAQLKLIRAWNYFQLVRHWGGMPLLTEENVNEYFTLLPSRSSVAETYELIESDLIEAIQKLPEEWSAGMSNRPNKDAARGILAKVYVTMATAPLNNESSYAKAASMAKQVIDGGKHSLIHDIRDVFSEETEESSEMMWSFWSNAENKATDPKIWSAIHGWGDYSVDIFWVDSVYPEQPRKYEYLEIYSIDGIHHDSLGRGVGINKFLYVSIEDFIRGFSTVNMPIIRYADVLLIFAEAENMAKGGPTQEAVDAINQVINRANDYKPNPNYPLLTTSMSKKEFDNAVINERSYELCFEYDRWLDMVRKRIIPEVVREHYVINFTDADYLYPIPEFDIRLNPNMEQNPGY